MTWESASELWKALGLAVGGGLSVGAMVALFNSWRA